MNELSKILIFLGGLLLTLGVLLAFLGKIPGVGRLPGDIFIKRENFSFYFPVTTSILLSIFLSFLFSLFNRK